MSDPLHWHVQPRLADASLVLAFDGWNDAGEAATGAAEFLAEAINAAPLAEIDPEEYYDFTVRRPLVRLDGDGVRRIEWPVYGFRFGSIPDRCEIVVGSGGEPHLHWRSFCDQVAQLVRAMEVKRVVLLGAFLADVLYSRPVRVSGFSSSPEFTERLGVEPTGYEGPTGVVGVLAERLREEGVETVSLWAGLPHYITVSPNPRGTLALVQKVIQLLDFPVDQEPLEAAAAEFEQQISKIIAADPALAEYVKDLKRREFAQ
jgi:proteasome assembly chaperone (PAC2) family protein